jgi:hydroxymethylpyrimidine/phosphomethylpyrimidine kinase
VTVAFWDEAAPGLPVGTPIAALSIAGSDPSGGAGIQADLKTFGALGAYGMAVVTALTVQNTRHVARVEPVAAQLLAEQLQALIDDIRIDTVKIGMLATEENIVVVRDALQGPLRGRPIVLDPVLVSSSGTRLLDAAAVAALRTLLPLVDVVTPNLAEAVALTGFAARESLAGMRKQAHALRALGAARVLVTGGDLPGDAVDVWVDEAGERVFTARRVRTPNTHGTGCALSSALAALRPLRPDWQATVADAKHWLTGALRAADGLVIGEGVGPVHHFHASPERGLVIAKEVPA